MLSQRGKEITLTLKSVTLTQYNNKCVILIANLINNTWQTEITYDLEQESNGPI